MKTRFILFFILLLCLPQVLSAQLAVLLDAGASVTTRLNYRTQGENTSNYYVFSTADPLLFRFDFTNFQYAQGGGSPLPQATMILDCRITENIPGSFSQSFSPKVDGKTSKFLVSANSASIELPAGNYKFAFINAGIFLPPPLKPGAVTLSSTAALPSIYSFDLHITTEAIAATVPNDAPLPGIPSVNNDALVRLPASSTMNNVCSFTSSNGNNTAGELIVSYVDGLGRNVQTARKGYTVQKNNLVSLQEYDAWGRKGNIWLDAAKDTTAGAYVSPVQCKTLASLTNNGDSRPYTESVYEASPLSRLIKQYGPGKDWNDKGKAQNFVYTSNTPDAGILNCQKFTVGAKVGDAMPVTSAGYYAAGSLQVIKTSDEDGNIQMTFTDRNGNTILKRQTEIIGLTTVRYDTYYLYDGLGLLRAVLPPQLSAKAAATGSLAKAELDKYAYLYAYDDYYRLSERKLPGTDWERFVYDNNDRPILSQDGNLRKEGKWRFCIADKFGRACLEGICTSYKLLPGNVNIFAEYIGKKGIYHGYSVSKELELASPVFHKVSYFDNYCFLNDGLLPTVVPKDSFNYISRAGYGEKYVSAKGSTTGTLTAQMEAASGLLASTFYYDARGRMIQSHAANHLNGVESEYIAYNFSSQPLNRMHVHSAPGKATLSEVYTHTYDANTSLPLTSHHRFGNLTAILLSDKVYDALGRLSQEKRNGKAPLLTSYAYNLRSWLTGITGPAFTQNLYYNADGGNATKCYNGNISSMTWKGSDATIHGYKYTYDRLNRMLDATYGQGTAITASPDRFTEQVTSYDKNGNILGLKRYGQTGANTYGLIDNLSYTLNGNQLLSVNDAVTTPAYNNGFEFKDGAKVATEYTYDANGNLTKDLNKSISTIQYNYLNLPGSITFADGSAITYTYNADGEKIRTVHKIGTTTTTTDYCGNVIYENGTPKRLQTEGSYLSLSDKKYHFYLQDHQGNNRQVASSEGIAEETNHYYPFGGIFGSAGNVQPYKYNGKELDAKKGLDWYDYGARHYEAALGRFTTVDPSLESYFETSPYAYCGSNPVARIDPTGADWYEDENGNLRWQEGHEELEGYSRLGSSVSIRFGENSYFNAYQNAGIVANRAVNAFDLISQSAKLQNQFLGKDSPLSETSKSELFNGLVSREMNAIAKPIGEALVEYGAGELGGPLIGKTIGWAFGKVAGLFAGKGYESFLAFKKANGAAGPGMAWHHIVEQNADNIAKFGAEKIHNTKNLIRLPHGKGSIHAKLSGFYSSKPYYTNGLTIRKWLSTQSYDEQYKFGIETLKDLGWNP